MINLPTNDNEQWILDESECDAWDPIYMQLREQGLAEEQADEIMDRIEETLLQLWDDGFSAVEIRKAISDTSFEFWNAEVYPYLKAKIVQSRRQGFFLVET